ncbi:MAG: sugar phosphate nucleotidyltransferase, partial [Candidatus Nanohaloarchaea archaeon]
IAMKAIVLAGGHATRLWPLTRNRAKPLLPLAGKPIIAYSLDQLENIEEVDSTVISTNARYAEDFREFVEEEGYENVDIVVEEHQREEEKVGSLGAIMQVVEELGSDDYLVVGGDNYPPFQLSDFLGFGREKGSVAVGCFEVDSLEDAKPFGVVDTDEEGRMTGFEEKPEEPPSRLVSTAFYYFPEDSLEMFDRYVEEFRGSGEDYLDEPGRLLQWGHERYDMYAYGFEGRWFDIGNPDNYLEAQKELGEGRVEGEVRDSELGENVWVMEGAEVRDSELEDCMVFPGAEIGSSSLKGSIVDREAVLSGVELEDSVVGEFSRLS